MRRIFNALPLALAVPFFSWPAAASDRLPVPDGIYFRDADYCSRFHSGEFDMVEFQVENDGRSIGLPEVGCLVATVKEVRANRFVVEADCLEFGEPWQYTFFLDVVSNENIRIDGDEMLLCSLDPANAREATSQSAMTSTRDIDGLIDEWHDADEGCRGGFGNDPATDQACDERQTISDHLAGFGYCYGRSGEPGSQYEWHQCGPNSIRP